MLKVILLTCNSAVRCNWHPITVRRHSSQLWRRCCWCRFVSIVSALAHVVLLQCWDSRHNSMKISELRYWKDFFLAFVSQVLLLPLSETLLTTSFFPVLGSEYLVEKFEQNPALQGVPNLHTLLHETYKYKAYPNAPTKYIKTKPRKGTMMWDNSNPDFSFSSDRLTATNDHRQNVMQLVLLRELTFCFQIWSNVRCLPVLPEGISYREYKVKFTSYIMVGCETKDNFQINRSYNQYPGNRHFVNKTSEMPKLYL